MNKISMPFMNKSFFIGNLLLGEEKSESKMTAPGNSGMEQLIPIINGLMDACSQTGLTFQLDLPQIAVVGCQSAGKSSVLENFVGRDFLPRGCGIVTRCPLILKLTNAKTEYAKFLHCPDEIFEDFDEIRTEIEEETDRITGKNKGISENPINLQIFSPHVLNITLVDLPGLTKVPIGDQPPDIAQKTRDIILKYISKKNCLILAVTPANIDLANSDALKLAQKVDPHGARTVGVITKLDLMDAGTDARDVLENKVFRLDRGYVGVVNRSQKDIDDSKEIQDALKAEHDFFIQHPSYNHMAEKCGTSYLQKVLNRELTEHIRKSLPDLKDELHKKIICLERELVKYNELYSTDPSDMKHMIQTVAQGLNIDFKNAIGAFGQESVDTDRLSSGARINRIFHERLAKEIENVVYDKDEMMSKIDTTIRNIHGFRCGLYSPQMAFEEFTKKQISKMNEPVILCIQLVIDELSAAVRTCTQKIIYPNLRDNLKKYIFKFMSENEQSSKKSILALIEMEMAYMNTNELDFSVVNVFDKNSTEYDSDGEEISGDIPAELILHDEVEDLWKKITFYVNNVKKNLRDMVPKAITLYIIKKLASYINRDVLFHSSALPSEDHPMLLKLDGVDEATVAAKSKLLTACKEALNAILELNEQTNGININVENEYNIVSRMNDDKMMDRRKIEKIYN